MTVLVNQIYFRADQVSILDESFCPYDNSESTSVDEREYWVFRKNYLERNHLKADYVGYLSWKFNQKTRISGADFLAFIRGNPGYDVYFINPFPLDVERFKNVWVQGDHFHPNILQFSQKIFDRLNYNVSLAELVNDEHTAAYCNYWVGNEFFWDKYMSFTTPFYNEIREGLSGEERAFLSARADKNIDANYFPFIFERMFSTVLATDSSIKSLSYNIWKKG